MLFGIGTMRDCFQLIVMRSHWREKLNRAVTDGATLIAVHLSLCAEILSGSIDLDVSRDADE